MSYSEVKSLPIKYRHWYLSRLVRHFKEKNEANNKDSNYSDTQKPLNLSKNFLDDNNF
jgi:hypothetical protein